MRTVRFAALGILIACLLSAALPREDHGSDRGPVRGPGRGPEEHRPRAILYQDIDFQGGFIVVDADRPLVNFAHLRFSNGVGANDRVSSIRLENGAELLVFRDADFHGGALQVTQDIRNLRRVRGGWNDIISSARIEQRRPDRH